MRTVLLILVSKLLCAYHQPMPIDSLVDRKKVVILEGEVHPQFDKKIVNVQVLPTELIRYAKETDLSVFEKETRNELKWVIPTDIPLNVGGTFFVHLNKYAGLAEPGDSIHVRYYKGQPIFSGQGATKFELAYQLSNTKDSLDKIDSAIGLLSKEYELLTSVNEYFIWNRVLNAKVSAILSLIDSYRNKISPYAYNIFKEKALYRTEKIRINKFYQLVRLSNPENYKDNKHLRIDSAFLSNSDLCNIYDSTVNGIAGNYLRYEATTVDDPYYLFDRIDADILRQKGMFYVETNNDILLPKERIDKYVMRYNWVKENYKKGKVKEELLSFFFHYVRGVIYIFGFHPKVESILADYYKTPGYPEYKHAVKAYEMERRAKEIARKTTDFSLLDAKGKIFSNKELKGKVAVLDFWFTGCIGCIQMAPALKKIEEQFKKDTNIVFISVSIDKKREQWLKSIAQQRYTTGNGLNMYTGGEGKDHPIIRSFGIEGYPHLIILNAEGKVTSKYQDYDPRTHDGKKMTSLINKELSILEDGPYVMYEKEQKSAYYAVGASWSKQDAILEKSLTVQTDLKKVFHIKLKSKIDVEPSVYEKPEKIFVISDIEGNFSALRQLLQSNNIVDSEFNWTFGKGHLVFAGDMFDRGQQVTECLWLLYSLEEKAKIEGGYVHFILGNHEIMNLQGDHLYVDPKYKINSALLGKNLTSLYDEKSELGRWLRTKNIMEKIGDILFLHGGVSRKLNNTSLDLRKINEIARPYLGNKNAALSSDTLVKAIYSSKTSPFWYRSYYENNASANSEMNNIVDSTLGKFEVNLIVTGHTLVADTISVHFNKKVINIDTHHSMGMSEALLIEGTTFYRVDADGNRIVLFRKE